MQVEYLTDLMFRSPQSLATSYEVISQEAIFTAKTAHASKFLGKKIPLLPKLAQEMGLRLSTPSESTRIKHRPGTPGTKTYDKADLVVPVGTTITGGAPFQTLPQGGTSKRRRQPKNGTSEKFDLQTDRSPRQSSRM
jgi:hypothetical protein